VTNHMQRAINAVNDWCIGKDLLVNDKITITVFTRRIK